MPQETEAVLPAELRGPGTTINRVTAGWSGAGVYKVDAKGRSFALKIASSEQPLADWRRGLDAEQLAATAGLAPVIVHVNQDERAVLSEFIVDQHFLLRLRDPGTRDTVLAELARTLCRVHELPLGEGAAAPDGRDHLARTWSELQQLPLPAFVVDAATAMLENDPPPAERAPVLSHNDVNPTNLLYDGANLWLVDWAHAAPNDPFFDLASISVFLNLDRTDCEKLLAAYDDDPAAQMTDRFHYMRRLVAVLFGSATLNGSSKSGSYGFTGAETLDSTMSLGDFYQRMRSGELSLGTEEGLRRFGLAMFKAESQWRGENA